MKATLLGTALALLSFNLSAFGVTVDQRQFKGENVYAYFYQLEGCNSISVSVSAFSNMLKIEPGTPEFKKEARVTYYNYDLCAGQLVTYAEGSSLDANFQLDNGLNSAVVQGIFTITDRAGNTKTAQVNLTLTGSGDIYRGPSNFQSNEAGQLKVINSFGAYRVANTSGSVNIDGQNVIANIAGSAYLQISNDGKLVLTKG